MSIININGSEVNGISFQTILVTCSQIVLVLTVLALNKVQ